MSEKRECGDGPHTLATIWKGLKSRECGDDVVLGNDVWRNLKCGESSLCIRNYTSISNKNVNILILR